MIHATADLRRTLGQRAQLLAPGGLLAMLEVTAPQRWFDLTVGLTEGWWAFTDTRSAPRLRHAVARAWLQLLGDCGFDAAAALPRGDGQAGALGLQSLLLARAPAVDAAGRHWLAGWSTAALADALSRSAGSARGDRCTRRARSRGGLGRGVPRACATLEQAGGRPADRRGACARRWTAACANAAGAATRPQRTARSRRRRWCRRWSRAGDRRRLWLLTRGAQQVGRRTIAARRRRRRSGASARRSRSSTRSCACRASISIRRRRRTS